MNFISDNVTESDKAMFFGLDEDFIVIENGWIMAHVMHRAGIFKSVSQAKKNGWNRDIPSGFHKFIVGKNKKQIWTLNIIEREMI
jgi:hypothetical protein